MGQHESCTKFHSWTSCLQQESDIFCTNATFMKQLYTKGKQTHQVATLHPKPSCLLQYNGAVTFLVLRVAFLTQLFSGATCIMHQVCIPEQAVYFKWHILYHGCIPEAAIHNRTTDTPCSKFTFQNQFTTTQWGSDTSCTKGWIPITATEWDKRVANSHSWASCLLQLVITQCTLCPS